MPITREKRDEILLELADWVEWQDTLDISKREWNQEMWFADFSPLRGVTDRAIKMLMVPSSLARIAAEVRTECDTAYCAAGYIVQKHMPDYKPQNGSLAGILVTPKGGQVSDWTSVVGGFLGLTKEEAHKLFNSENTAADIRKAVTELVSEKV